MPNPNVLIELGYAIKTLGWSKIICLFNSQTGKIEDLPFDINHNRVTAYTSNLENKKRISEIISLNSLSSTTHNYRNIDKNKQKWYNRSARKKAEKSKKACT